MSKVPKPVEPNFYEGYVYIKDLTCSCQFCEKLKNKVSHMRVTNYGTEKYKLYDGRENFFALKKDIIILKGCNEKMIKILYCD